MLYRSCLAMVCLVVLAGCSDPQGAGKFAMPPMPVEVAQAKLQKVIDRFDGVGTIEATDAITVVSEINAAVVSLPFQEGGYVKKNDLIAQLDDGQLAAEVARDEAIVTQNRANYERIKILVEQKASAVKDLDDATADLKISEANLALSKAKFEKTRIRAPFSGLIGARKVSIGAFLRTGDAITELANIDEIRVTFAVPERFLLQLKQGTEITVSSAVNPDLEVKGRVTVIEPIVDESTRNARVVARVANPGQKFRPGMSANISVVLNEHANAITIPNEAIFASGNQSFVFVVKADSTVARTALTLGIRLPDVVEVLNGLEAGATIVEAGHQKLFDGAKVMPMASQTNGQAKP
ncbi:efflux RND transporter periplasmic adaptor subunit [bacterium]|nr:efflux RND transporter periplasmic adaptor subunit [bacterium]